MISLAMAKKLKEAGLVWVPQLHDFFAIPDRGFDRQKFVISEILSLVEFFHGRQVVTFHGTAEWALDYLVTSEAVWLPTEAQLRQAVLDLAAMGRQFGTPVRPAGAPEPEPSPPAITLVSTPHRHRCELQGGGRKLSFEAADAGEAYARALLYLLENARH